MGWLDYLAFWKPLPPAKIQFPSVVALRQEANSPDPVDTPDVEPIGYTNDVNPLNSGTKNNAFRLVMAALSDSNEPERAARYRDFDLMDKSDIKVMINNIVRTTLTFEDVTRGRGFIVSAKKKKIQKLLERQIKSAKLTEVAEEILRDIVKYGDALAEPLFSSGQLTGVQCYKPKEMFVTRDEKGKLPTSRDDEGFPIAYQQRRGGKTLAGWMPWEIIHFKFMPSTKTKYSLESVLEPIREDWRKLQLVESGMVVARITRAYPRRNHYIDVTNKNREDQEKAIANYINRVTKKVKGKRPTNQDGLPLVDVADDTFITTGYTPAADGKSIPKLNKIENEDPNIQGLGQLADVEYLRQKVWSQVPSDVVGIKRNTSDDLDSQDVAYANLLRELQFRLEAGLRAILDQVLLANGYLPGSEEYRIVFPDIQIKQSWKFADSKHRLSLFVRNMLELGITSRHEALRELKNYTDQEIAQIFTEIEQEQEMSIFQPDENGIIPATGAQIKSSTSNGIDQGTDISMGNQGNQSGDERG